MSQLTTTTPETPDAITRCPDCQKMTVSVEIIEGCAHLKCSVCSFKSLTMMKPIRTGIFPIKPLQAPAV